MNCTGYLYLCQRGFPVIKETFFFKELENIPHAQLEKYMDERRNVFVGFDTAPKLTNNPTTAKDYRESNFSTTTFSTTTFRYFSNRRQKNQKPKDLNTHLSHTL